MKFWAEGRKVVFSWKQDFVQNVVRPVICLIVDDDRDDQELFSLAIQQTSLTNFSCVFAEDGGEALELLDQGLWPDFIFLDLNMPRVDGMQCLKEIRKREKMHTVAIAVYTTSDDDSIKTQAMSLGATAFITKPNRFDELVNRLDSFLKTHGRSAKTD